MLLTSALKVVARAIRVAEQRSRIEPSGQDSCQPISRCHAKGQGSWHSAHSIIAEAFVRPRVMPVDTSPSHVGFGASAEINTERTQGMIRDNEREKSEDGVTQNSEGLKRRDLLLSGTSLMAASALLGDRIVLVPHKRSNRQRRRLPGNNRTSSSSWPTISVTGTSAPTIAA